MAKAFLNTGDEFDVRFSITEDNVKHIIPAHKSVLIPHSPVLEARLLRWETSEPIVIQDVSSDVFYEFLQYMYTGTWKHTIDNALQILGLSNMYQVSKLFKECQEVIQRKCKSENCVKVFLGTRLIDTELNRFALDTMTQNLKEIIPTDDFLLLPSEVVLKFLKNEDCNPLPNEATIYNACERWALSQCEDLNLENAPLNLQKVLGEAFRFIRFTSLLEVCSYRSSTYDKVRFKGPIEHMLTKTQLDSLVNYVRNNRDNTRLKTLLEWTAFVKPRSDPEFEVQRFEETHVNANKSWTYRFKKWDKIGFSCDKEIQVVGIGYYGCSDPYFGYKSFNDCRCEYKVTVKISSRDREHIALDSVNGVISNQGEDFRMNFETPVTIQPGAKYIIASCVVGPRSYYGIKGQNTVTTNCDNYPVTFQFEEATHTAASTATGVSIGVIPSIFFNIAPDGNKEVEWLD